MDNHFVVAAAGGTDLVDARTLAAAFSSDDGHDLQRSSKGLSQECHHHCAHVSIPMDMQPKNQGQDLPNVVTSAGTNPHVPFVSMMAWSCASNALASSTDSPSAVPRHAAPTQSNSSLLVRIRGRGKLNRKYEYEGKFLNFLHFFRHQLQCWTMNRDMPAAPMLNRAHTAYELYKVDKKYI